MSHGYHFTAGRAPLLISVPHDGREIPASISERMTSVGRKMPDTDWHVARLYKFAADMGAAILVAKYSRYVVDLNRAASDDNLYPGQVATGLCPEQTFSGEAIYHAGSVGDDEKRERVARYWRPYHDRLRETLDVMRKEHGHALLWDAHSIPSVVPRLFDGELPEFNIGTNSGASCSEAIAAAVHTVAIASGRSTALNGRFKGGFITRHYGAPGDNIHAVQLEIAQRAYMHETTMTYDADKAKSLRDILRIMLQRYVEGVV